MSYRCSRILSLAAAGLLITTGCKKTAPEAAPADPNASAESAKTPNTAPVPTPPANPKPAKREFFAGAHILIAYKGANRAAPTVTRTKDEAEALAKSLTAQAKKAPGDFAELAKKHSDGPSGPRGGDLGVWPQGRMVPAFDKAIAGLKVGEVTGPVETPFGFHVMKRNELPPFRAGAHILIAYKGAVRAAQTVTRSKEEAKALAEKLARTVKADPAKFDSVAKEHSDGPYKNRGGSLGKWPKGQMVPDFDKAIDKLKIGEVSGVVETPFGFHVFIRMDPDKVG